MKSSIKKLPKSQIELKFQLDPEQVEKERQAAFEKLADQVKVPGFRPGRAPKKMLEERINPTTAMQQALDTVLNQAYQEQIVEHQFTPVAPPEVSIDSIDYSKPIDVTLTVQVRPEAKVGDYRKIKADKKVEPITDEKLNDTMKTIFERSTEQAKQPSHSHDHQSDQLVGADGQPLSDQAAPDRQMDDAWAKTLGAKDLEDLRQQVRSDLESAAKYEAENQWQEDILTQLIDQTKTELPQAFIDDEISRMRATFQQQLSPMGISYEDYLKQAGKDQEEMEKQWLPQAEKQAKLEVALAEIAKQEDIKIEEAEVEDELSKVDEKTRAQFSDPQQRQYLVYSLWRQKILRHILESAEKAAE